VKVNGTLMNSTTPTPSTPLTLPLPVNLNLPIPNTLIDHSYSSSPSPSLSSSRYSSLNSESSSLESSSGIVPLTSCPVNPPVTDSESCTSTPQSIVRVAIVGTAGRSEDFRKMNPSVFKKMYESCVFILRKTLQLPWHKVHLISGGAAWSDHIAVLLFNDHLEDGICGLTIHLPCPFLMNQKDPRALDNGSSDWKKNPGRVMNSSHERFSSVIKRNSLSDIYTAAKMGAKLDDSQLGFHARNTSVARCDVMIAFTWSPSLLSPKDGGTADTWGKASMATRIHVPLPLLSTTDADKVMNFVRGLKIQNSQTDSIVTVLSRKTKLPKTPSLSNITMMTTPDNHNHSNSLSGDSTPDAQLDSIGNKKQKMEKNSNSLLSPTAL